MRQIFSHRKSLDGANPKQLNVAQLISATREMILMIARILTVREQVKRKNSEREQRLCSNNSFFLDSFPVKTGPESSELFC